MRSAWRFRKAQFREKERRFAAHPGRVRPIADRRDHARKSFEEDRKPSSGSCECAHVREKERFSRIRACFRPPSYWPSGRGPSSARAFGFAFFDFAFGFGFDRRERPRASVEALHGRSSFGLPSSLGVGSAARDRSELRANVRRWLRRRSSSEWSTDISRRTSASARPGVRGGDLSDLFGCSGRDDRRRPPAPPSGPRSTRWSAAADDVEVVFDHDDSIAAIDEAVDEREQLLDVDEVETSRGFIEEVERLPRALARQLFRKLHPLRFAAGERGRGLAELDVAKANIDRTPAADATTFGTFSKSAAGLLDRHVENIGDVNDRW